jgi:hypothetical protein
VDQRSRQNARVYQQLLGFERVNRVAGWALLQPDEVELMLSLPSAHTPFDKIPFTGSCYFHPHNVEELRQQLKDKARVVYPLAAFDCGMRQFAIRDHSG